MSVMLNEDNFLRPRPRTNLEAEVEAEARTMRPRPRTNFLNPKITYNIIMHLVMKNIGYVYVIHPKIVTYNHDHELEHVYTYN